MEQTSQVHQAGPDDHRLRLDRYLHKVRPDLSRRQIEALLRTGAVRVNDRPRGPGYFIKRGDRVLIPGAEEQRTLRDVLWILRLPELLALGKPPGMPTVPAPRRAEVHPVPPPQRATLQAAPPPERGALQAVPPPERATRQAVPAAQQASPPATSLLEWLRENLLVAADASARATAGPGDAGVAAPGAHPPGVVHRLDRDTSGTVIFSLSPRAHQLLVQAFRRRQVRKTYLALVQGRVHPPAGVIDLALARDAGGSMRPARTGLPARTSYQVLHGRRDWSLLRLEPLTGRMHQIRAHLAAIGHPVLGDPLYGRPAPGLPAPPRLWLHAWRIELPRPVREALHAPGSVTCPLWEDLAGHLEALEDGLVQDLEKDLVQNLVQNLEQNLEQNLARSREKGLAKRPRGE